MLKFPRILFFISSPVATDDDQDEAATFGPNVSFRNASMVSVEGALEKCDGVAGQVPARYAAAYPSAQDAIVAWQQEEQARRQARAEGKAEQVEEAQKTALATFQEAAIDSKQKSAEAVKASTKGWKAN